MTKVDSLADLLLEIFPTDEHLFRFLRYIPNYARIVSLIPRGGTPYLTVLQMIDFLRQRGLIDTEFFERLTEEIPSKEKEINRIKSDWLSDIPKWTEFPKNKESITKSHRSPSVFVSYSRSDEAFFKELSVHLELLRRKGVIKIWDEGRIRGGSEWHKAIRDGIKKANIIILLVSPDFLSSDFLWDNEVALAFERDKKGNATIIPVILRPCSWSDTLIGPLQVLPSNGKPLILSSNLDRAWLEISEYISHVAKKRNEMS